MERDWGALKFAIPLITALLVPLIMVVFGLWFVFPRIVLGKTPPPEQPINFPHTVHVQELGIDCTFCHRNVAKEAAASVPAVEQCMFCHKIAGKDKPEIQKLAAAWDNKQPINWKRVHRLPDHVQFVHEVHIQAGFECTQCHGDVASMEKVRQDVILRMGDCVNCHRQYDGPTDCAVCHY